MTPEQKKQLDDFLKSIGSENTVDKLEAIRKRAVHTLEEWCAQTLQQKEEMPLEVKDMKLMVRFILLATIAGRCPIPEALSGLELTVEAAYNLGRANKPLPKT